MQNITASIHTNCEYSATASMSSRLSITKPCIKNGVSVGKLVLGVPFYGYVFRGVQSKLNFGLNQRYDAKLNSTTDPTLSFREIESRFIGRLQYHSYFDSTTKSPWLVEHMGHKNPVIIANDHYMLNAVGLPDAGLEKAQAELSHFMELRTAFLKKNKKRKSLPLIANIVAGTVSDFELIAKEIAVLKPDIIEVNISCPNVESEFGKPFACVAVDAATVTKHVKKVAGKIPVTVKLSPNVEDIVSIAKSVVDAGADALTVMNSAGPGMAINLETRSPILANRVGGLTGPALKPLAVKYIYDIRRALPNIPIIGTGGVLTGQDALEMMMAGATLVAIGSGVAWRGVEIFDTAVEEMASWCDENGVKKVATIIGTVK